MASVEVKLAEILLTALVLLGLGTWTGYHFTRQHYEVLQEKENTASEAALATARGAIITLTQERDAAVAKEEAANAARVKADADIRGTVDERMRGVTAALRAYAVSSAVGAAASGKGSAPGAAGSGGVQPGLAGLDESLARFGKAVDGLLSACQHDSREVTAIQEVAPKK